MLDQCMLQRRKAGFRQVLGVSLTASNCRQGQSGGAVSSQHNRLPPGLYNYLAQGHSLHCLASESNHQREWPVALKRKNMNLIVNECLSFKPIARICETPFLIRRVCFEGLANVSGRLCIMKICEDSQSATHQLFFFNELLIKADACVSEARYILAFVVLWHV